MLNIRPATPDDLDIIIQFTKALAEYEKMLDEVSIDAKRLHEELFGPQPWAFVLIAEWDGKPAGFAVNYRTFSTFLGKHGIYIEDLFVDPAFRGKKIGYELVKAVAKVAVEEGCERVDWQVLTWNQPSIDFYDQLGAYNREGWYNYRLENDKLRELANG
ncbi:MAG: GNAT family N-acetyltransferase [Rickettsiales bacterium]|nr:GNAT family N-acetyltransferase [Rickettsiales bacterium]